MYTHPDIQFVEGYPLRERSTVGLGPCVCAAFAKTRDAFLALLRDCTVRCRPYHVLGRMSNTLAPPEDDGTLYIFTDFLADIRVDEQTVTLGAGCRLSGAISYLAARGLHLLPSLCGVPGSVGGAVYSNAGAFGESLSDAVLSCLVFDTASREVLRLSSSEMAFSYRHSILRDRPLVLLECTLDLTRCLGKEEYECRRALAIEKRRMQQPTGKSLGCVFKQHEGVSVGMLIDRMGYKGREIGGIFVSERHAGFLINRGDGDVLSYRALVDEISQKIYERYGFVPQKEITVL